MGNSTPTLHLPPVGRAARMDQDTFDNASYELALLTLLAGLEFLRQEMEPENGRQSPEKILAKAEQILEQLVAFAGEHLMPESSVALREAIAQGGLFRNALTPVREQCHQPGGWRKLLGLGRKPSKSDTRQEQFTRCLDAMNESALQYFIAFTERFPDSKHARPWVETAAGFVADLKRVTHDIKV